MNEEFANAIARVNRRRSILFIAAASSMGFLLSPAGFAATPSYLMGSSTATYRHGSGTSTIADKTLTLNPPTSSNSTLWTDPMSAGSISSVAYAGIGAVTNPTTTTFAVKPGTGVTQLDPPHSWGASTLKLTFTGQWKASSSAFGPTATTYFSMAYGGVSGGAATAQVSMNFTVNGGSLKSFVSPTLNVGPTVQTYTNSQLFNGGTIPAGAIIQAVGTILFSANNGPGFTEARGLSIECGSAPPTATAQTDVGGNWTTLNWNPTLAQGDGTVLLNTFPNSAGYRARFANISLNAVGTPTVNINTPITIGTLDVDDDDSYTFSGSALTFDVLQGEAVIHTGNSSGTPTDNTISSAVMLAKSAVVQTEAQVVPGSRTLSSASNLSIGGQISGAGSTQGLTKIGEASLSLGADNLYAGGTAARGGYLDANVTGSLGTGTVLADDGQLNYNAAHASGVTIVSNAQNNGQVNLGIVPTTEKFAMHDLGAISGSPAELTALSILPGGNLTVDPGTMIAHENFDFGDGTNPQGLFNVISPLYIFGIATDMTAGSLSATVGSNAGSIWKGFGGDRGNRIYGADPNSGTQTLTAAGTTELVSLHNSLTINARLQNSGTSSIIKRGGGTVIINNVNNTYSGPITVQAGTLAIGGGLNGVTNLLVNSGGVLSVRNGASLSAATINVNGGQAIFDGGTVVVGRILNAFGELHVNGGTVTNTGTMNLNPDYLAEFRGGSCIVGGAMFSSGTLLIDGGNLTVQQGLTQTGGPNSLTVDAGSLNVSGTMTISRNVTVNGGFAGFHGNVNVGATGLVQYNGGIFAVDNTLTVNGGSFLIGAGTQRLLKVGNVATPGGGRVDLNDSDMQVTASSYGTIATQVSSARALGAWNGPGITSTAARNDPQHAKTLGILTGAQVISIYGAGSTFDGSPVAPGDTLVGYTYYGDTDFNNVVNFDDYSRTDAGFNTGGTDWFHGDFDFNGVVDFDDYSLIDLAFNVQSGTLPAALRIVQGDLVVMGGSNNSPALRMVSDHLAQFGDSYAHAFLSAVPEPGLAVFGVCALGAMTGRSRKRLRSSMR